jgi:predicted enzyme related to lactoylglutathione lyase
MTESDRQMSLRLADEQTAPAALEVGLVVRDIDFLVDFYRNALGCEVYGEFASPSGLRLVALLFGSSIFKLAWREELPKSPDARGFGVAGYQYLSFRVTDMATAFASAVAAGAKEIMAPTSASPTCVAAIMEDPEGNLFELVQGAPWEAEGRADTRNA